MQTIRIDKWLWAVRICKTRQMAIDLCKRGKIKIAGQKLKSSRLVNVGDVVEVQRQGVCFRYEVLKCIDKRVGAKVADECKKDCTDEKEKLKYEMSRKVYIPRREKGAGRPTKKERRKMDVIM